MPSIARAFFWLFWVTEKEKSILEKKYARLLIVTNLFSLLLFFWGKITKKDYTHQAIFWAYLVVKLTALLRIFAVIVFLVSYLLITLR